MFIVLWMLSRHVFYLMICWSIYFDFPRLAPFACYRGTADHLKGPLPVSPAWSDLLEPFRDPGGIVCLNNVTLYGFLFYLLTLQVMMALWSVSIIRVAFRVLNGKRAEDIRSDAEDEGVMDEDDGEEDIEQEVGVEAVQLKRRECHASMRIVSGSSGVSLTDRKELLNRIGCEKRI